MRSPSPAGHRAPLLALALALLLAACERDAPSLPEPDYAAATCAQCRERITAPRHAAQLQRADGTVLSFDAPVCLFRALSAETAAPRAIRFHGAGESWIAADEAWFAALPPGADVPKEGWTAFPSFAAAQDAVAQAGSGEILPFAQVRERIGR